jgi:hypothetical protein
MQPQSVITGTRRRLQRACSRSQADAQTMNAIIREKYEAPVLTNETIEVHLTSLRKGFDSLTARIETVNTSLTARIEAINTSLSEKIEKANAQRAAGDAALSVKMDKLTEKVPEIQKNQKALLWSALSPPSSPRRCRSRETSIGSERRSHSIHVITPAKMRPTQQWKLS